MSHVQREEFGNNLLSIKGSLQLMLIILCLNSFINIVTSHTYIHCYHSDIHDYVVIDGQKINGEDSSLSQPGRAIFPELPCLSVGMVYIYILQSPIFVEIVIGQLTNFSIVIIVLFSLLTKCLHKIYVYIFTYSIPIVFKTNNLRLILILLYYFVLTSFTMISSPSTITCASIWLSTSSMYTFRARY